MSRDTQPSPPSRPRPDDRTPGRSRAKAGRRRPRSRRRPEDDLRESHDLLARLFDDTHVLMAYLDADLNFVRVNRAYAEAGGHEPEWFVGRPYFEVYPHPEHEAIFRRVVATGQPFAAYEKPFFCPATPGQGVTYWDWSLRPVRDAEGRVRGVLLVLVDVTERRRLERDVVEVAEAERRRLGRDLHDGLGQDLAGIAYLAQSLADRLAQARSPEAEVAREIAEMVRECSSRTRALARGLCPVVEEPEGLVHALRDLAETTAEMYDVVCRFECPEPVRLADTTAATHLYRIAQEAVSNAARHGRPRTIVVRLQRRAGAVVLTVEDDGVGMPEGGGPGPGLGLRTMRYRAAQIGGVLEVRPRPGGGTVVRCVLSQPEAAAEEPAHDVRGVEEVR